MRILLVHPPFDRYEPPEVRLESLGLGYLASTLRNDGHDVEILDAQLGKLSRRGLIREILTREFDCLGITALHSHARNLFAIARAVREQRKDATILAGGYLPTLSAEALLAACPELDFVIRGEGETAASEVLRRIADGKDWRESPGVAYRDGEKIVLNPPPPLVSDLDSLPFPARDALKQAKVDAPALISSSRGCYHQCSFCCIRSFYGVSGGKAPRMRSPESVLDEIEHVIAETGIRGISFVDDNFLGVTPKTRERVIRIAEGIRNRKLGISFSIECRADEIDLDILKLLKEAGLSYVFVGIESGVQRQLDLYNKRTTVEQNKRAIGIIREAGVGLIAGFIMLDPYVTTAEVLQNTEFLREMKLSTKQEGQGQFLTRLNLYHGLPLLDQLRKDGLLREKGLQVDYTFKDPQVRAMYAATRAMGACMNFLRRLAKPIRKRL